MEKKHYVPLENAEDYVARQPLEFRETLEKLRTIIKETIPDAEELICYQVICYKYKYILVGIGTIRNYCSFYTMSQKLVNRMKSQLKDVKLSGPTLHLPLNKPLPIDLIKKIIRERVIENKIESKVKVRI
ncbi:iron chaperone [Bacteroidota bacterium]